MTRVPSWATYLVPIAMLFLAIAAVVFSARVRTKWSVLLALGCSIMAIATLVHRFTPFATATFDESGNLISSSTSNLWPVANMLLPIGICVAGVGILLGSFSQKSKTDAQWRSPMSIAKLIDETIAKFQAGDVEGAFIPASIAVAATAAKECPRERDHLEYKDFIRANLALITKVAFGAGAITKALRIKYDHPDLIPGDDGLCSVQQVLYHVVRCGLLPAATLPSTLRFADNRLLAVEEGNVLVLPARLVLGLVLAVVSSPSNAGEMSSSQFGVTIGKETRSLADLWGKREQLLAWLQIKDMA